MPILYSVVSRGSTVLAKYACCGGNFAEVTDQILSKIPPENGKLTYTHASYLIHYICEDQIIYLCITDDDFERSKSFAYLTEIKRKFQINYGARALVALPYGMNSEFSRVLSAQMKHFSETDTDTISKVQGELSDLKDIMVKNIDNIASRGERLELLVHKAENLQSTSVQFRSTSRNLQRSLYWKNIKITVIIVLIGMVMFYIFLSMFCGGLTLKTCF